MKTIVVYDPDPDVNGQVGYIQHSVFVNPEELARLTPEIIADWETHTSESHVIAMLQYHPTWRYILVNEPIPNSDTHHVLDGKVVERDAAEYAAQEKRRATERKKLEIVEAVKSLEAAKSELAVASVVPVLQARVDALKVELAELEK